MNQRLMYPMNNLGDYASINTIEFRILGFIAQLRRRLARRRHKHATAFKDHHSDLSCTIYHEDNNREAIT